MATKDEALKMAIEVLDLDVDCVSESKWINALNACKEALEQPAQKPKKTIKRWLWSEGGRDISSVFYSEEEIKTYRNKYKIKLLWSETLFEVDDD